VNSHTTAARFGLGVTTSLLLAGFVAIGSPAPSAPASAAAAVVEQPRSAGYFLGDLVTQRVLLESEGRTVSPANLPATGRVSAWFERRRVTIETDPSSRRWLVVQYQVLNAPPKLLTVTLPAWLLAIKSPAATFSASPHNTGMGVNSSPSDSGAGGSSSVTRSLQSTTLKIAATSVNIAPLSPPGSPTQIGVADLRPDRLPAPIPTAPLRHAITFSSGALAVTLAAWLGWIFWRNRRATATQPFARALREMRALGDHEPRAWQALHRAFDGTAGHVIQSSTLPELFERAPQLEPARAQIERFFAQSSLMFFASPLQGAGRPSFPVETARGRTDASGTAPGRSFGSSDAVGLRALCTELRRIERSHER
jgi:mxaA protein